MAERNLETSSIDVFSLNFISQKDCFHQKSSFVKGCLPSEVVFHHRSSSTKDCIPSKAVFHQRLSSIKDYLSSKVIFHQRLLSNKGRLLWMGGQLSIRQAFISNVILLLGQEPSQRFAVVGGWWSKGILLLVILSCNLSYLS